jgi:hypothetical protein
MPRYFKSSTVSRAVTSSAGSFIFEPSIPMGGGWLGVLAVDEPTASNLAADLPPSVWEISEDDYLGVKKKVPVMETGWQRSPQKLPKTEAPIVVVAAESRTEVTKPEKAESALPPSVELKTTRQKPPAEPLLEMPSDKRGNAARKAA